MATVPPKAAVPPMVAPAKAAPATAAPATKAATAPATQAATSTLTTTEKAAGGASSPVPGASAAPASVKPVDPDAPNPDDGDDVTEATEQGPAEVESELAALREELAGHDSTIKAMTEELIAAQNELAELVSARDAVVERIERMTDTGKDLAKTIRGYLDSQHQVREEAAARAAKLVDAGFTAAMLDPRDPVDRARDKKAAPKG